MEYLMIYAIFVTIAWIILIASVIIVLAWLRQKREITPQVERKKQ